MDAVGDVLTRDHVGCGVELGVKNCVLCGGVCGKVAAGGVGDAFIYCVVNTSNGAGWRPNNNVGTRQLL